MRVSGFKAACAVLVLSTMVVGCGEEEPEAETAEVTENWLDELPVGEATDGLPAGEMRVIEVEPVKVEKGRVAYQANCVPCHGEEGEGRLGIGPQLNSDTFLAAASDGYLVRTIARGRPGTTMPPWSGSLARDDVEGIVAYMRSWKEIGPAELDDSPAEGDVEEGEARFREICAACHGRSGAGYQETSNGTGIGREAFLADVSNGYLRYIIQYGKSDTPMRPFGLPEATAVANLTDEEVENVITYLRVNAW